MTAGPPPVGSRRLTPARAWFLVLVVVLVAAVPLLLHWGRHQWFFLDEWSFLVNRGLGHPSTLLAPHNGHWVTVPAIAFRVLFQIFGLRYRPYQAADVVLHLCGVALIWATMRRLGVRPWLATLTAVPFAFFGAGLGNILFAFQITLTGSFVFGLAQLLLATANPPDRRKDVLGVVCGLVAIMSSAVGIPMVIGATVAAFLRRGWRAAALHGVPLAVVYVAWYLAYARDARHDFTFGTDAVVFSWQMGRAAFVGLGQNDVVAVGLVALAALGVAAAVRTAMADRHSPVPAVTAALIAARCPSPSSPRSRVRTAGTQAATSGRYIYIVAGLLLPVVALGGEWLARRWVVLGAIPVVLLAIALPSNVDLFRHVGALGNRDVVVAAAYSPLIRELPADTRLFTFPTAPTLGADRGLPAACRRRRAARPSPGVAPGAARGRRGDRTAPDRTGADRRGCPVRPVTARDPRPTWDAHRVLRSHRGVARRRCGAVVPAPLRRRRRRNAPRAGRAGRPGPLRRARTGARLPHRTRVARGRGGSGAPLR